MRTALDVDVDLLDDQEKSFVDGIRTHGWFGTHVSGDDEGPGFSYTTGFWRMFGFPELMVFSLPQQVAHSIFWNFYRSLEAKKNFSENEPISEVLDGYVVIMRKVRSKYFADHLGWNRWFYGGDTFEARQVFWPDRSGRFPWAEGVAPEFSELQPNLSEPLN